MVLGIDKGYRFFMTIQCQKTPSIQKRKQKMYNKVFYLSYDWLVSEQIQNK